ncbi:hypothetical protein ABXZ88_003241 [Vibrio fluvialis]
MSQSRKNAGWSASTSARDAISGLGNTDVLIEKKMTFSFTLKHTRPDNIIIYAGG